MVVVAAVGCCCCFTANLEDFSSMAGTTFLEFFVMTVVARFRGTGVSQLTIVVVAPCKTSEWFSIAKSSLALNFDAAAAGVMTPESKAATRIAAVSVLACTVDAAKTVDVGISYDGCFNGVTIADPVVWIAASKGKLASVTTFDISCTGDVALDGIATVIVMDANIIKDGTRRFGSTMAAMSLTTEGWIDEENSNSDWETAAVPIFNHSKAFS